MVDYDVGVLFEEVEIDGLVNVCGVVGDDGRFVREEVFESYYCGISWLIECWFVCGG